MGLLVDLPFFDLHCRCENTGSVNLASLVCGLLLVLLSWVWYSKGRARLRAETELRDVSTALETLAEPVIMMRGHTITSVNHATLETFGYESKSELEGQGVTVLMQTPEASKHSSFVDRFERTGERRIIGKPRVVTGKRRDGSSVSLTLSVSPCAVPGEYIGILYRRTDAEARATRTGGGILLPLPPSPTPPTALPSRREQRRRRRCSSRSSRGCSTRPLLPRPHLHRNAVNGVPSHLPP